MDHGSSQPRPKRTRRTKDCLEKLLIRGDVSQVALAKILRKIKEDPDLLSGGTSQPCLHRASTAAFDEIAHTVELELQHSSGETEPFVWEHADPNKLVSHLVSSCPRMADAFADAASLYPCSASNPWRVVMTFDEYDPGHLMDPEVVKKTMALNFSFFELGQARLAKEQFWFTPVLLRTSAIALTRGGWSRLLCDYLKVHFLGATGIETAGLPLKLHGQWFLLFAKLFLVCGDGEGLQKAFQWAGAGGIKPCLRHWNVLKLGSNLAHRDDRFVEIDCACFAKFCLASSAGARALADALVAMAARVAAGNTRNARLKAGLNIRWSRGALKLSRKAV